ncbi:S-layer homology domain-containing protein [Candidatus Peregrinibacteria bacterium]|nr:S-layer homology domain-containing protein [Candidatus Peregrinibacteria bacterium]
MKKFLSGVLVGIFLGAVPLVYASLSDVTGSDWYAEAVQHLTEKGIIKGYSDGTFRPSNPVNRAELAIMLDRVITYIDGKSGNTTPPETTENTSPPPANSVVIPPSLSNTSGLYEVSVQASSLKIEDDVLLFNVKFDGCENLNINTEWDGRFSGTNQDTIDLHLVPSSPKKTCTGKMTQGVEFGLVPVRDEFVKQFSKFSGNIQIKIHDTASNEYFIEYPFSLESI